MKKLVSLTSLIILLLSSTGCSQSTSEVEDLIKKNLKDPDSAKFQGFQINDSNNFACIHWNAKNSFGGYSKWKTTEFYKINSKWSILGKKSQPENCTSDRYKLIDKLVSQLDELHELPGSHNSSATEKIRQDLKTPEERSGYPTSILVDLSGVAAKMLSALKP